MKDNTQYKIAAFALISILNFWGMSSAAQEIMKHPRVVELEDSLKDSAAEYVKSRFPAIPFMVTIKIDPLRRDSALNRTYGGSSQLTYFDPDEDEEIRDEWDNPQVPLKALINRVKRITVDISVPSKLRESDVNELKDGIFANLHLTPARDEVGISRRDWITEEPPWLAIYLASGILIALLIGLLLINRTSANRIARALGEMKISGGNTSAGAAHAAAPLRAEPAGAGESRGHELTFNDPIKIKELAARHIEFLAASPSFPNHRDIFILDKLGKRSAEKLGAILAEFPADTQSKLFAYSFGVHWIEGLNAPGFLDFDCLEIIQALTQNPRKCGNLAWDHAVLSVWRLDELRTQFLKSLQKDEAFALLSDMPKAIAVHEARKAFPGSWATMLDLNFKSERIASKRIQEIEEGALRISPLNSIEMVQQYRIEKELLDYLKIVDPAEERDIYGALNLDSMIHKMRAPFFPVFEQSEETLRLLVPDVTVEHWAMALFNMPKSERSKIDVHLNEKQRFLLVERFKSFDQKPPSRAAVSSARENIGNALKSYLEEKQQADDVNNLLEISDEAKAA